MKQTVPLNTGKVLIGSKWTPPVRQPRMQYDDFVLQRALLHARRMNRHVEAEWNGWKNVIKDSVLWMFFLCVLGAMYFSPEIVRLIQQAR